MDECRAADAAAEQRPWWVGWQTAAGLGEKKYIHNSAADPFLRLSSRFHLAHLSYRGRGHGSLRAGA